LKNTGVDAHREVRGEGVRVNIGPPNVISKDLLIKMQ
jgi:hypothetical protein